MSELTLPCNIYYFSALLVVNENKHFTKCSRPQSSSLCAWQKALAVFNSLRMLNLAYNTLPYLERVRKIGRGSPAGKLYSPLRFLYFFFGKLAFHLVVEYITNNFPLNKFQMNSFQPIRHYAPKSTILLFDIIYKEIIINNKKISISLKLK